MLATRQHERYPVIGKPGHFLTPWGDEIFEPPDDLAEARRVVALTGEPERPFVSRVRTIDGRLPTAEQIAAVECELQKAHRHARCATSKIAAEKSKSSPVATQGCIRSITTNVIRMPVWAGSPLTAT